MCCLKGHKFTLQGVKGQIRADNQIALRVWQAKTQIGDPSNALNKKENVVPIP